MGIGIPLARESRQSAADSRKQTVGRRESTVIRLAKWDKFPRSQFPLIRRSRRIVIPRNNRAGYVLDKTRSFVVFNDTKDSVWSLVSGLVMGSQPRYIKGVNVWMGTNF